MFVSQTDTRSDGEQNTLELEILLQMDGFADYPSLLTPRTSPDHHCLISWLSWSFHPRSKLEY
jgi:hypothetical protein